VVLHRIVNIAWACLLLSAPAVHAHGYSVGAIRVQHPWANATAADSRTAAVFMRIENRGRTPDRLLSATGVIGGRAEPRAATGSSAAIALPAGKTTLLEPGGLRILLGGLQRPLLQGERITLLLRFENAGELSVEVEIQGTNSRRPRH